MLEKQLRSAERHPRGRNRGKPPPTTGASCSEVDHDSRGQAYDVVGGDSNGEL
jgi:hypothetical protein